ncbi:MAG: type 1 glutamine amidotransferase domain-containing protein [Clostridiales bacterium]|nr:type 1 glutamine amidotransferase domain-containing protein [Clostridiales bacterium]
MNKSLIFMTGTALTAGVIGVCLPKVLNKLGLHPYFEEHPQDLTGKKALLITTSHDQLGDTGKVIGVYSSEMTIPYYHFLDANMTVDLASIKGGRIPIEPKSMKYPLATPSDNRFLKDKVLLNKVEHSLLIDDVNFKDYDIIFMAGGWGAAYDLGTSDVLGNKLTEANAEGILLGSVCHGALGFMKAKETNGEPLVKGKKITAVTDKQIKELKISQTPMHPETELINLGADFQKNVAFKDVFANLVVIDGNIVTGQNQNASAETAYKLMKLLKEKDKHFFE